MKKLLFACALAVCVPAFAGCGAFSTNWVHPTKTQADMETDVAACNYELDKMEVKYKVDSVQHSFMFEDCMKAKGWRRD